MNSSTKRFQRATGKLIRKELVAWLHRPLQYSLMAGGVAILIGLLISFLVVAFY